MGKPVTKLWKKELAFYGPRYSFHSPFAKDYPQNPCQRGKQLINYNFCVFLRGYRKQCKWRDFGWSLEKSGMPHNCGATYLRDVT
jgi:hypothetical protein